MRRVAVIRGATISPWEMQNFVPLGRSYDVALIGALGVMRGMAGVALKKYSLPDLDWLTARVPWRPLRWRAQRRLRISGQGRRLIGLEILLRGRDLVHTVDFHYPFSHQAARYCRRSGKPLVVTRWENIPFMYHRFQGLRVEDWKLVAETAAVVVGTTVSAIESIREEGTTVKRTAVVLPGVDLERFQPGPGSPELRRSLGLPEDEPVVLFVGRLTWEKGALDLIRAFARLGDTPGHLLMVGSGPDAALLEDAVGRLGLDRRVSLGVTLPYDCLPELYRTSDAFILPSIPTGYWEEQFGMVLAEALASGLPVISCRTGGIPEVVGEAGILTEPHSVDELARCLKRVLDSPSLRQELGLAGRSHAEKRLGSGRFAQEMQQIYDSV